MDTPNAKLPQDDFFQQVQESEKSLQKDIEKQSTKSQKQSTSDILNNLMKSGQVTDEYELFNIKWEMKILNQDELLEAQKETIKRGLSDNFTSRFASNIVETLAMAITKINGEPISSLFKDIKGSDFDSEDGYRYEVKSRFRIYLGRLAPDLLDELFNKYTELNNKKVKQINELKKK